MTDRKRLLILGGTSESAALAALAESEPRLEAITSLAGRTRHPARPPGKLRVGGFGGAAGLSAYITEESIDLLVDATHPYAARISAAAAEAASDSGVPRLLLRRPAWKPQAGDRWLPAADNTAAAQALHGLGKRVFLSIGRQDLAPFAPLSDLWFLVRMIDRPDAPLDLGPHALVLGRGPFAEEDERELLVEHRIEALVSKNSGGSATYAKLAAARSLGLPVVMIERPAAPPGCTVDTIEAAWARIQDHLW